MFGNDEELPALAPVTTPVSPSENLATSDDENNPSSVNTSVIFLPPKKTSWVQPLDQGIIRAFKEIYHREFQCRTTP